MFKIYSLSNFKNRIQYYVTMLYTVSPILSNIYVKFFIWKYNGPLNNMGLNYVGQFICIFFSKIKYYICGLRSAESVDIELWTWKIHCKIILKFWTSWGMAPLTHIVGVQTVYSTTLVIIGMYIKCFQDIG